MTTAWGGQPPNFNGSTQTHWGADSIGILGSVMAASWTAGEHGASPLANDSLIAGLEYRWYVDTVSAGCSIVATELGDAALTVPTDGSHSWTYRLVESGVLLPQVATVTTVVGAAPAALTAAVAGQAAISVTIAATGAVVAGANLLAAVGGQAALTLTVTAAGAITVNIVPAAILAGHYATQPDLVTRFGTAELAELTDPAAGTTIDAAMVARALADADAQIDLALRKRYTLPLASVPEVLVRLACDIARYLLWDVRASDQVRARYKDATAVLDRLASGELLLGDAAALPPSTSGVAVVGHSPTRRFSDTLLDQAFGRNG